MFGELDRIPCRPPRFPGIAKVTDSIHCLVSNNKHIWNVFHFPGVHFWGGSGSEGRGLDMLAVAEV